VVHLGVEKQRYDTFGDYYVRGNELVIKVLADKDKIKQFSVVLHEFVEAVLCILSGVDLNAIDDFDVKYEEARSKGRIAPCGCRMKEEPGDDKHAPYYGQHAAATKLEVAFEGLMKKCKG
jgi:hypothetical protein